MKAASGGTDDGPRPTNRLSRLASAILLTAYFLYFNLGSLKVHFALDDLGNIDHYHNVAPWQMALSQFLPWRGDPRPMGGLFYIPIYHFAGLNPVPYQAVLLALLLANVYWVYRFAKLLGCCEAAALLAALAVCYHAGLANLYYNAAFVFDVLCCFFYLATLVYYLRIRNRNRLLGPGRTAIFLALFLCALNSKEMAVTIPLIVLVYEWCYHRPAALTAQRLWAWVRGPARLALIAAVLDLLDVYGKIAGPGAMTKAETYHPVFTLSRLYAFHRIALRDLFSAGIWTPGWGALLAIWVALALVSWVRSDLPVLRFLFWFLVVVPIPIEFLVGKAQACLCLLMVGWAIFVAVCLMDAIQTIGRAMVRYAHFNRLARCILDAALVAAIAFYWARDNRHLQVSIVNNSMASQGFETWDLIQQFPKFQRPHPGSRVAFLSDPLTGIDMWRLAELWVHDLSTQVHVGGEGPLTERELAKMDYIYTFEGRRMIQLK
jgi:hypothetical protein